MLAGLVVGLFAAIGTARAMSSLVFGIPALDPITFMAAPMFLLVAVALASLVPALRAAQAEPVATLRDE